MSQRLNEYFATEASEYLDQLNRLLALEGKPDVDHLLRLATGVRGSARMAGAETVAGVAERLEDAARSIVSDNIAWSDEVRSLAKQTVEDLKLLVRALNRWGPQEERRVREAIVRWDDLEVGAEAQRTEPDVVPVQNLFYDDAGPHIIEASDLGPGAPDLDAGDVVPIEELLLRGESALRAAMALRPELERLVEGHRDDRTADELIAELFDLIALGLTSAPSLE